MAKPGKEKLDQLEQSYPGIGGQMRAFDEETLPACSHCGSTDTARVQVGITGRTMGLAAATRKFKLIPNGPKPGKYFCNACEQFFG